MNRPGFVPTVAQHSAQHSAQQAQYQEEEKVYSLILDLTLPNARESALLELSKKREAYEGLAPILWHSFGVMTALLQEIISVYPALTPPTLTGHASNRVCNALALLQCVASHNETRVLFLNAHIPLFLYPFLNTTSKTRPFEYLRLTSLGVIGALVKNDNTEVINFLLSTEIIPLCLRIMETGSELSKTVAIFIVQKILLDDMGLTYICQTYERFYAVATVLGNMVGQLVEQQSIRLLKHVIRCYLRLSDNPRAREALRQCLPEPLKDATFSQILKDDMTTKRVGRCAILQCLAHPLREIFCMNLRSWFALATNAPSTSTDIIIATMAHLPPKPHLKYIRVLYEKIRRRGLSKNNMYDLMGIIRDHLKIRNLRAIEYDLKTPNHWTESRKDLLRNTETEKKFIDLLLKNIRIDNAIKDEDAWLLQIWGYLGASDRLTTLKEQYPMPLKTKSTLVEFINANIVARGLQEDVKAMEVAYNFYHSSSLPSVEEVHLNYCKFLILNNRNNMIPAIINSKKYSNDDLYFNVFLPMFANCSPSIFCHHFENITPHIKKILLGDIRIRLLFIRNSILVKSFRSCVYLIKSTDPTIFIQHPDIVEGFYLGFKSVLEKRNTYLNQEEKIAVFRSIPSLPPKDIAELYPMMDFCYADLEKELLNIKNYGPSGQINLDFRTNRRLLKAYWEWAKHFRETKRKPGTFAPNREDFLLIIDTLLKGSLNAEEVENSLVEMIEIMEHFAMEQIPDEARIEVNQYFKAAKYIPVNWKIKLSEWNERVQGIKPAKMNPLSAASVNHFRHLVRSNRLDEANCLAVQLIDSGYQFLRSPDHFIRLVNMNISRAKFKDLRVLFRGYLKSLDKQLIQEDTFYFSTLFSMMHRKLYLEAAELIEEVAASTGVLPEREIIIDLISQIAKLPQISRELLQGAICVFSYFPQEKLYRKIVEEMIYIAFAADKDLDLAIQIFNTALKREIKFGNWYFQHLLHIFAAHRRQDLMLRAIEAYLEDGGTIMPINVAFEYFVSLKDLEGIKKVLRLVRKSTLDLDALSYKWILQGFACMDSNMQSAEELWKTIKDNAFSYSDTPLKIMILGYSRMRTAIADEKMVNITLDWMQKKNQKVKVNVIESVVSFMIKEGFIDCADYFLETMRINLKELSNAEMEYLLLKGYLETRNVPMVLQSFHRLLECFEDHSTASEKMAIYESLVDGLQRIGQTELAEKYKKKALGETGQYA